MENIKKQAPVIITIVLAALLIAGAVIYRPAAPKAKSIEAARPLDQADHIRGNRNADFIVLEYSDLECPFCKRFHSTMEEVYKKYGETGKVAWAYRHLPLTSLHSKAENEAIALECAGKLGGNDIFWKYMDTIFTTTTSNDSLDPSVLDKTAADLGLKAADFTACRKDPAIKAIIDKDSEDANNAGAQGTPFIMIISKDDKRTAIAGAVPFSSIDKTISDLLGQ